MNKQTSEMEKNPVNITQSMKDILIKALGMSIARYNYCEPTYTNQNFTWAKDFRNLIKKYLPKTILTQYVKFMMLNTPQLGFRLITNS